jgi:hypothetical protein
MTLLSWAWVALTIETDNAFEAVATDRVRRCTRISLPMWTNGLRHIDPGGVTVDQLRARAAARCNIGGLERWGWISVGDGGDRRRDGYGSHRGVTGATVLRPTRAGEFARRTWPEVIEGVERRWQDRFGATAVDALRSALLAEPAHPTALPWSPPEVNPSDGFRTQAVEADGDLRSDADARRVAPQDRPLVALLGQTVTRRTLEHEGRAQVSLPLGANVLRVVDEETVRLRDLPALSGISKEAVAMAITYLRGRELARTTPDRGVALTTDGLDALDGYRERGARASGDALRAALDEVLTQTAALSSGLTPPPGCWRAENPYLAQTRRLLGNPTGSLPWQPMVLHRAGWPDGS